MPFFVIVGLENCPQFAQVAFVAKYLDEHLPNFHVRIFQKRKAHWAQWLQDKVQEYKWDITQSPVIYREFMYRGGVPHLIGSISEFWQYCFDFYHLEAFLSPEEISQLIEDNKKYFGGDTEKSNEHHEITIFGASSSMLPMLLLELNDIKEKCFDSKVKIKLYDSNMDLVELRESLNEIVKEMINVFTVKIEIVESLKEAIVGSNLMIIIDDLFERDDEPLHQWRLRNIVYVHILVDHINHYALKTARLIFAHYGPVCFNATLFIDSCTSLKPFNIVAITSDLGYAPLSVIAKEANVDLKDLGAPIIWGCVGINTYVDIGNVIKKCDVYRPNTRAIRMASGSTLPLGTIRTELRFINYITDNCPDVEEQVDNMRNRIKEMCKGPPVYSKLRSIISLLTLWYTNEKPDAIISLGVWSDGSFNITPGIVFSQPVILKNGKWSPFAEYPLRESTKIKVRELADEATDFMTKYIIRKRPTEKEFIYV